MRQILMLALLMAIALPAADLAGRWTGTMEKIKGGPAGPPVEDYHLTLEQNGDSVTGTVGPAGADFEIQKARLDGQKLSFEITVAEFIVVFNLELSGNELAGTMQSRKGPEILGKLRFQRAK